MKVAIVVTDNSGKRFSGECSLTVETGKASPGKSTAPKKPSRQEPGHRELDFSLPARAFARVNRARDLGGAQRFVLLLAWMAKGQVGNPVELQKLRKEWNRMTAPMGGRFNPAYSTRAKDNGWVETLKHGSYKLRSNWKDALRA